MRFPHCRDDTYSKPAYIYVNNLATRKGTKKKYDIENKLGGRSIYLFSVLLIVDLGGTFNYAGGIIPMFGTQLPALATAAVVGILLNLMLSLGDKSIYEETEKSNEQ